MPNLVPVATTTRHTFHTKHRQEFITITQQVEAAIAASGVQMGTVTIQSLHTTASIWVNEDEKNLIGPNQKLGYTSDLSRVLDRFADPEEDYGHNDVRDARNPKGKRDTHLCDADSCGIVHECINGHAHAQAMILPCSVTMIVENGKLVKGRWQQIMLIELDHDRERQVTILVQGIGEKKA
ncbi:MAG: YjbQ family protein [Patescibacteria group bacterium]|jgi:secondary thiamine-phosphate synthase enzyme